MISLKRLRLNLLGQQLKDLLSQRFNSLLGQQHAREVLVTIPLAIVAGLLVLASSYVSGKFVGLYLMAVAGLAAAAVVGNTRKLLLVIVIADGVMGMDKSFLYRPHMGGAKGIELTLTTMAVLPYWFMWLAQARRRKNTNSPPGLALSVPTVGIIMASTLSMLAAKDVQFSIFALVRLFQFLLLYAYVVHNVQSKEDLRFFLNTLMAVVLVESLLIILQYFTRADYDFVGFSTSSMSGFEDGGMGGGWRPAGTLGAPNEAAAYLVPRLMLIFGALMSRPTPLQKYLGLGAVSTGLVALIATQSRAGWGMCLTASILLAIFALRRGYVKLSTLLLPTFIILLVVAIFSGVIIHRLTTDDNDSASDRLPMMRVAQNMVRAHPIVGVGVNNYAEVMKDYPGLSASKNFVYVVHNRYMYIWAETGTIGLLCLVWFVAVWLRNAYYVYRQDDPRLSPMALGIMVGVVASLIGWSVESLPGRQEEQAIWMMAALSAALYGLAWQQGHRTADDEATGAA
jgi:putative inorganic carbon (HCO3(-)) transporter